MGSAAGLGEAFRRAVRNLVLFAAVAVAIGARAATETVGGYMWTYCINGDTAEICNDGSAAISPSPTDRCRDDTLHARRLAPPCGHAGRVTLPLPRMAASHTAARERGLLYGIIDRTCHERPHDEKATEMFS